MEESHNIYDQLIEEYTAQIAQDPDNAAVLYNKRGVCYYNKGDYNTAVADFTKIIKIEPENLIHYFKRGVYLQNIRRHKSAIKDFSKILEIEPKNAIKFVKIAKEL